MTDDPYTAAADELAVALAIAHRAATDNDRASQLSAIDMVADSLGVVFAVEPIRLPALLADLATRGPVVRRIDLESAVSVVALRLAEAATTCSPILHVDAHEWILDAATRHHTNPTAVTAWCAADLDADMEPVRPLGLPISIDHRAALDAADYQAVRASIDVRRRYDRAANDRERDITDLLELLEPIRWAERDLTLADAITELHGPDRVRAEELLASLPSVANLTEHP